MLNFFVRRDKKALPDIFRQGFSQNPGPVSGPCDRIINENVNRSDEEVETAKQLLCAGQTGLEIRKIADRGIHPAQH